MTNKADWKKSVLARRAVLAILGAFALGACGGPVFILATYSGPPKPRSELAVLRVRGDEPVQLIAIDGEAADARVSEDAALHVELLPGKHTIWVQNLATPELPPAHLRVQATAGALYGIAFNPNSPDPTVYALDPKSYARVAPVSAPETAPPAISASAAALSPASVEQPMLAQAAAGRGSAGGSSSGGAGGSAGAGGSSGSGGSGSGGQKSSGGESSGFGGAGFGGAASGGRRAIPL